MDDRIQLCLDCKWPVHPGACFPWQTGPAVPNSAQPDTSRWSEEMLALYPDARSVWERLVIAADSIRSSPQSAPEVIGVLIAGLLKAR